MIRPLALAQSGFNLALCWFSIACALRSKRKCWNWKRLRCKTFNCCQHPSIYCLLMAIMLQHISVACNKVASWTMLTMTTMTRAGGAPAASKTSLSWWTKTKLACRWAILLQMKAQQPSKKQKLAIRVFSNTTLFSCWKWSTKKRVNFGENIPKLK